MNEDLASSIQAMLRDEGIRVILRVYEGQVYLYYRGPTGWWMTSFLYDPIMPQPTLVDDIVDEARKMSRKLPLNTR